MNQYNYKDYQRVIALKEMSAGNAEVGSMWIETKSFAKETPIKYILEWGSDCKGKLIITIDEEGAKDGLNF